MHFRAWLEAFDAMGSMRQVTREPTLSPAQKAEIESQGLNDRKVVWYSRDIQRQHQEENKDINQVIQIARKRLLDQRLYSRLRNSDYARIPGFDELARDMADAYPVAFGGVGYDPNTVDDDKSARLYDLLQNGEIVPLSRDDAIDQAIERMVGAKGQAR